MLLLFASAQSSQSTTPVHEPRDGRSASGRFYVATPDLLSSDTDVTSPENHATSVTPARSTGSSGAAAENGPMMQQGVTKHSDGDQTVEVNHFTSAAESIFQRSSSVPEPHSQPHSTSQAVSDHKPSPVKRYTSVRDVPDRQEMTMDGDGSRSVDSRGPGFRIQATNPTTDHQRDSSPINRLAGLFKNLARF